MTKIDEVKFLIVDAIIVIDYLDCDERVFVLTKEHIGLILHENNPLFITKEIVKSVLARLGIEEKEESSEIQ